MLKLSRVPYAFIRETYWPSFPAVALCGIAWSGAVIQGSALTWILPPYMCDMVLNMVLNILTQYPCVHVVELPWRGGEILQDALRIHAKRPHGQAT